jgi:hypothetical protein
VAIVVVCAAVVVASAVTRTRPEREQQVVFEGVIEFIALIGLSAMSVVVLVGGGRGPGIFLGVLALFVMGLVIHSLLRFREVRRQPEASE